jgi:hypothetical protein
MNATNALNAIAAQRYGGEKTKAAAGRATTLHARCFASATQREVTPEEARAQREAWPLASIERLIAETDRTTTRDRAKKGIQK